MPDDEDPVRRLNIDGRYKERNFCVRSAIFEDTNWLKEKRRKEEKKRSQKEVRRGGRASYVILARDIGVYRKII